MSIDLSISQIINKENDFDMQCFKIALALFKESEDRDANMDDMKDMNAVACLDYGIKQIRLFYERKKN